MEDMVLSALVQEQMEGITPEAIVLMTPKKMAVSFTNDFRAMFTPRINLYVALFNNYSILQYKRGESVKPYS